MKNASMVIAVLIVETFIFGLFAFMNWDVYPGDWGFWSRALFGWSIACAACFILKEWG